LKRRRATSKGSLSLSFTWGIELNTYLNSFTVNFV
jgi:hypothetical protein